MSETLFVLSLVIIVVQGLGQVASHHYKQKMKEVLHEQENEKVTTDQ